MQETLFHGTSEALAKLIKTESIRPGATDPIANPEFVYLTETPAAALAFGYSRVMAIVRNGTPILQPFVPKLENSYRVAIFEVNRAELVQSLLQEADRKTLGSIDYVYAGVIPRAALVSVEFVTIDKRVVKIARSIFDPERQHLLVGKDLGKHLKREGFEITPE